MVELTKEQTQQIRTAFYMIGHHLFNKALHKPFEEFEFHFVTLPDPETLEEGIKEWIRIALALERWRAESNYHFSLENEKITFIRLMFLASGDRLEPEYAEEEKTLLSYLADPIGSED